MTATRRSPILAAGYFEEKLVTDGQVTASETAEEIFEDDGSQAVPMVYVDSLTTVIRSGSIHKLVFARFETLSKPHQKSVIRNCCQITIPVDGFVDMYAFLKIQMDSLIQRGIIKQDDLDEIIKEKMSDDD